MRIIVASFMMLGVAASAMQAQADPRRNTLTIDVQPRSFLDAGKVVPVGSMSNYVIFSQYHVPPDDNLSERYGGGTLPPRIGAGRNPFGPIDYVAPSLR